MDGTDIDQHIQGLPIHISFFNQKRFERSYTDVHVRKFAMFMIVVVLVTIMPAVLVKRMILSRRQVVRSLSGAAPPPGNAMGSYVRFKRFDRRSWVQSV